MSNDASETTTPTNKSPGSWISIAVTVLCIAVLVSVLIPQILESRQQARRIQSKNNLKQIGLALHNYHDVYDSFPIGGTFAADGTPIHGWCFRIHPYMEASSLYSEVNHHLPWDHPVNEGLFRTKMPAWLNPEFDVSYDSQGRGLTHYLGNPAVLHRQNSVSKRDMTSGLEHSWLAGEINGRFQPWGYPLNWRAIELPLGTALGNYGTANGDGTAQFCLGDGAVRRFHSETDQQILQQLINAPPKIAEQLTTPSKTIIETQKNTAWTEQWLQARDDPFNVQHKGGAVTKIFFDPDGHAYRASVYSREDGQPAFAANSDRRIDLPGMIDEHPELQVIDYAGILDTETAKQIVRLKDLRYLIVRKFSLDEKDHMALKKTLPAVQIFDRDGTEY